MKFEVCHRLPGRLRLKVASLDGNPAIADLLLNVVRGINGVESVRYSAASRCFVLRYPPDRPNVESEVLRLMERITPLELRRIRPKTKAVTQQQESKQNGRLALEGRFPSFKGTAARFAIAAGSLVLCVIGGPLGAALAFPMIVFASIPTCLRAVDTIRRERRLNVDFLDALAVVASIGQGGFGTAAGMLALIALGDWIREKTAGRSQRAIMEILDFQSKPAWLIKNGKVVQVPVRELREGDNVMVYPGELIPVDGNVLEGTALVDQRLMTGESLPVLKDPGKRVFAGTVIREGRLRVEAERVGAGTMAAQIVQMVESAPTGETKMQNYAEKFADRLVAPSLALSTGLLCLSGNMNRFVSMTIIDYGTGMRVAAPISVLSTMIAGVHEGIVIRSGAHLEKLNAVDTLVFDKTGTLTTGIPEVGEVITYQPRHWPVKKIIALSAAVESKLKHPVANAISEKAREMALRVPDQSNSEYEIGMGASAQVNGYFIHVGNERFFEKNGVRFRTAARDQKDLNAAGYSTLLFAVNGELCGVIAYADRIRPESRSVVEALRTRVRSMVMMTGDNSAVARVVARTLGIGRYFSDTMPAEKAEVVRQLQREGHVVGMVGDGINDSPALAHADVGIAMKGGADIARESAHVLLMEDNLWKLVRAIDLSKSGMNLIRQNYFIIAGLNTLALLLSIPAGLTSPGLIAALSNGSAILAGLNAARPLIW